MANLKTKLLTTIIVFSILACGSGGGGGTTENYAGDINLEIERDHIDSGDLNKISLDITNLNPAGAILKIRTSPSLRLVRHTPTLFPGRDEERKISADKDSGTDNERYTVFFLDPSDAIDGDYIALELTLKATSGDEDGFIEVDIDNNDPNIPDDQEFTTGTPRFTAKERRSIFIEREASDSIPTQTPTPAS